jgi:hypothetical protein
MRRLRATRSGPADSAAAGTAARASASACSCCSSIRRGRHACLGCSAAGSSACGRPAAGAAHGLEHARTRCSEDPLLRGIAGRQLPLLRAQLRRTGGASTLAAVRYGGALAAVVRQANFTWRAVSSRALSRGRRAHPAQLSRSRGKRAVLLIPSIDLRGGHCVRLLKGDFAAETRYELEPHELLRAISGSAPAGCTSWIWTAPATARGQSQPDPPARLAARGAAAGRRRPARPRHR